jgi:hypothetical protein
MAPKVDSPRKVTDYKLISLLNSSITLITKVLANMVQYVILKIIY